MSPRSLLNLPALLAAAIALGGCASSNRQVLESARAHRLQPRAGAKAKAHAITYDSRGRGAYITESEETRTEGDVTITTRLLKVCAEPPPDVSANTTAESKLSIDLEAAAKFKAFEAALDGNADSSQSASSTIADAATRTELVLMMRDALYRVCELNSNGVLDAEQARKSFESLLATARHLGQRDNVGKLVDVVAILAQKGATGDNQLAINELLSTIRYLATSDHLLAAGLNDDAAMAALTTAFLQEILGSEKYKLTVELLRDERERELKVANLRVETLRKQLAAVQKRVENATTAVEGASDDTRSTLQVGLDEAQTEAEQLELELAAEQEVQTELVDTLKQNHGDKRSESELRLLGLKDEPVPPAKPAEG